ncbi:hypothetical protein FRC04_008129 [Tulasnella sp. 424]|nr:hypothetical protein FRC04_008129 [Tulasnella sp. 424]KAG8974786.1 hypothetical protein FRC05_006947 [Tulasnella sp. 425]
MSAANLTPEQQQVLNIIQLFENTGGSAAYLKHLEEARNSTTENAAQFDENHDVLIELECDITISPAPFEPNKHYVFRVVTEGGKLGASHYDGEGYGHAPGYKPFSSHGKLTLRVPPGWDGIVGAGDVTFKAVKPPVGFMHWEIYSGKQAVMNVVPDQDPLDPALVGTGGPITWKKVSPYPGS